MAYIPEEHKKYNVLPRHGKDGEVFEYPNLDYIEDLLCGYPVRLIPYNFKSYEEYFNNLDEIDVSYGRNIIGLHNALEKLKKAIIKLNKKEEWSICRYKGESLDRAFGLTHDQCYYWPTTKSNPVFQGVIDDEEFTSYFYEPDAEDWEILVDPTGMAKKAFENGVDFPGKPVSPNYFNSILGQNLKIEKQLEEIEHYTEMYNFDGYKNFDLQIKYACELFYEKYNILPNVLILNEYTYNRIQNIVNNNYDESEENKQTWNKYIEKNPETEVFWGNYKGEKYSFFEYGKDIKLALYQNTINDNQFELTSRYMYDFQNAYEIPKFKKDKNGFPIIKAFELKVLGIKLLKDNSALIYATNDDSNTIYFIDRNFIENKNQYQVGKTCIVRLMAELDNVTFTRAYRNRFNGNYNETKTISKTGIYEFSNIIIKPFDFDKEDLSNGKTIGFFMESILNDDEININDKSFIEAVFVNESTDEKYLKNLAFINGTLQFVVYDNPFKKYHKYGKWYTYWGESSVIKTERFADLDEIKKFLRKPRKIPITHIVEVDTDNEIDIEKLLE